MPDRNAAPHSCDRRTAMSQSLLGTTHATQIGIIVQDVEATARAWAALLGVPAPEIRTTDTVEVTHTEYAGQPTPARAEPASLPPRPAPPGAASAQVTHTEAAGRPTPARAKLAFLPLGQVTLELIEPLGEPSTWHDQLQAHGNSLHHIAFQVEGMSDRVEALAAQ